MAQINSKSKGNTFERKIANLLSARFAALTGIKNGFRRSESSGSFFGGRNQARVVSHDLGKASFGDIICPNNFRYAIECKHYKTPPNLLGLITNQIADWDRWIVQATQDCSNAGKRMAIIVKYNNLKEIVILGEMPAGIACFVHYKTRFVISLDTFLSFADGEFFATD